MSQNERKLFGTDGVRGVANIHPMTAELAMQIGRATAYLIKKKNKKRHKIVIGKDTRLSGYMLENAITSGICSIGVDVLLVGPLPTPGIAFLTPSMRADAGIIISASHNPFQDNGIKIFSHDGFKLPDEVEAQIEKLISSNKMDSVRPTATEVGRVTRIDDVTGRYIMFLKNTFPKEMKLDDLRLVIDCANGAAYKCAPAVFEELGAKISLIGAEPNGENINRNCGALHPELVREKVLKEGADMGLALDGDADRAVFIDNKGRVLNGDHIMALCARDLKDRNELAKNTVVATVMSNLGLEMALKELGLNLVRTDVGDRYVLERMRQDGYNFGGEQSGHLIFLDHNTAGDGILSALQVLAIMIREGKSLSELTANIEDTPQVLVNVEVSQHVELNEIPILKRQFDQVREALGEEGRLLVRYSGTEPKVRVMVEGVDSSLIETLARETSALIEKELG